MRGTTTTPATGSIQVAPYLADITNAMPFMHNVWTLQSHTLHLQHATLCRVAHLARLAQGAILPLIMLSTRPDKVKGR